MNRIALRIAIAFSVCPSLLAAKQPNIIYIMADDLGWRDLGYFGSAFHQTPNLDKLAARDACWIAMLR